LNFGVSGTGLVSANETATTALYQERAAKSRRPPLPNKKP